MLWNVGVLVIIAAIFWHYFGWLIVTILVDGEAPGLYEDKGMDSMKLSEVTEQPTEKKHQENFTGPYWQDYCPVCDSPAVSGCRCIINDRECANGHVWHRYNGKAVIGSGH